MSAPPDLREVSRVREESFGAVLVTGASSGIGRACALHLAACGFRVFAGVRRESDGRLLDEMGAGAIESVRLDVTDAAQIADAARAIGQAVGDAGLAGIVDNAGISVAGMLEFLPIEDLRRQLEVNVIGVVAVTQAMLPLLRRARAKGARARIVVIGSSSGYLAAPLIGAYNASKFAIEGICDSWRQELAPFGIDVTLIEPGAIDTPIFEASNRDAMDRLSKLSGEAQALYAPLVGAVQRTMSKRVGAANPARTVALAVEQALRAERPRTRQRVGADATLQWLLARWFGDRQRDRLLARFLGLPKTGR